MRWTIAASQYHRLLFLLSTSSRVFWKESQSVTPLILKTLTDGYGKKFQNPQKNWVPDFLSRLILPEPRVWVGLWDPRNKSPSVITRDLVFFPGNLPGHTSDVGSENLTLRPMAKWALCVRLCQWKASWVPELLPGHANFGCQERGHPIISS